MVLKFLLKSNLTAGMIGAIIGSCEVHRGYYKRVFSVYGDDLYTGGARGFIRGLRYPYNMLKSIPLVSEDELGI